MLGLQFLKCALVLLALLCVSLQKCRNNSEIKYDLGDPAEITHYYSTCSDFTKRTCCSPKNIETLVKKIRRLTDSYNISSECKAKLVETMCAACDGDWGEGLYEGVCASYCQGLYASCKDDYFMIQMNSRVRACKEEDLFCWTLQKITHTLNISRSQSEGQAKICELFSLVGAEHEGDCWKGQISSQLKGRGAKQIDYTNQKPRRARRQAWWRLYAKEIVYGVVISVLATVAIYKWCVPSRRPHYYRLN